MGDFSSTDSNYLQTLVLLWSRDVNIERQQWVLTFTRPGESGREIGRYTSRDDSMLAAQDHFNRQNGTESGDEQDELGWQMSYASATAVSSIGAYRVVRSDLSKRQVTPSQKPRA